MPPASQIFLLLLCTFLTEILQTSGAAIRKPEGKCPAVVSGVRCLNNPMDLCHSNSDCEWLEMCCSNGCQKLCMKVPAGPSSFAKPTYLEPLHPLFPDHPIVPESPHFGPIPPPAKPFPDYPDFRPPYYPPQPDLPPIPVVPLDPLNYMADVNPFAYGREDYFN